MYVYSVLKLWIHQIRYSGSLPQILFNSQAKIVDAQTIKPQTDIYEFIVTLKYYWSSLNHPFVLRTPVHMINV